MQVFANLCDPHSFMRSIMKSGETYNIAACNFFEGVSINPGLLKTAFPNNPITVPVTGHSVFAKMFIDYIQMHASSQMSGDYRKFIEFFNVSGKLLFSIGFKADPYSTGSDVQPLGLYSWNDDGSLKTSKFDTTGLYPMALLTNYSSRTPDRALSFNYFNDPNDLNNSKFDVYYGGEKILSMSGAELGTHADHDPAVLYFFRNTLNKDSASSYRHRVSYIVVTDTLDLTLEPLVLKPNALISSVDFTGVVTDIADTLQDANYISCSAEVGKYIEFSLKKGSSNFKAMNSGGDLVGGVMSFYGRYLQIGGVSVTFTITIFNGGQIYYSEDVVVPANQDNSYYQTMLLNAISSALNGLSAKNILSYTVRIELKGV